MTHIDETQEAIACIRMNVDAYDAELRAQADSEDIREDLGKTQQGVQTAATQSPQEPWKLGCPGKRTTTTGVSLECEDHPHFRGFHKSLVQFLQKKISEERIVGSPLKV